MLQGLFPRAPSCLTRTFANFTTKRPGPPQCSTCHMWIRWPSMLSSTHTRTAACPLAHTWVSVLHAPLPWAEADTGFTTSVHHNHTIKAGAGASAAGAESRAKDACHVCAQVCVDTSVHAHRHVCMWCVCSRACSHGCAVWCVCTYVHFVWCMHVCVLMCVLVCVYTHACMFVCDGAKSGGDHLSEDKSGGKQPQEGSLRTKPTMIEWPVPPVCATPQLLSQPIQAGTGS